MNKIRIDIGYFWDAEHNDVVNFEIHTKSDPKNTGFLAHFVTLHLLF